MDGPPSTLNGRPASLCRHFCPARRCMRPAYARRQKHHYLKARQCSGLLAPRKVTQKLGQAIAGPPSGFRSSGGSAKTFRAPHLAFHCGAALMRSRVVVHSTSHPFPLSGVVAVAGSRHGSPFPVSPVVAAVLSAGGAVRVGCAPGVDAAVRSCCPSALVLRAASFSGPPRARLAARTHAVVVGASALCVFPPAGGILGPGSSLAIRCALSAGLPVWCAGPRPSVSASWSPMRLAGVPGFVCLPAPSLF